MSRSARTSSSSAPTTTTSPRASVAFPRGLVTRRPPRAATARQLSDVYDLRVPDPLRDGRMPVMIEATRLVRAAVGDEVAIRTPGTGPVRAHVLLRLSRRTSSSRSGWRTPESPGSDPDAIHHALDLAADALIAFGKACFDAGADLLHCGDSLASCDVILARGLRERWAFPYERKVIQAWKEHGARTLLHICGDSSKVLDLYAETGVDVIEVDHKVDLAYARSIIGDRACVIESSIPSPSCCRAHRIPFAPRRPAAGGGRVRRPLRARFRLRRPSVHAVRERPRNGRDARAGATVVNTYLDILSSWE
ncbi:MAG: hypothetical protein M5T61_20465 [Acidimicrobiia bacterium]|nr:hypothetical protein [Acidimicrobiia bacterium]